jgi:DNA-binding response OmpR family regulator
MDAGSKDGMTSGMVLAIDDDEDFRELLRMAWEQAGSGRLVATADGAAAQRFVDAEEGWPQLILLDLHLAGESGLEVLASLRAAERTRYVPILILTTAWTRADLRAALDGGATGFVQKPAGSEPLRQLVAAVGRFWMGYNVAPQP